MTSPRGFVNNHMKYKSQIRKVIVIMVMPLLIVCCALNTLYYLYTAKSGVLLNVLLFIPLIPLYILDPDRSTRFRPAWTRQLDPNSTRTARERERERDIIIIICTLIYQRIIICLSGWNKPKGFQASTAIEIDTSLPQALLSSWCDKAFKHSH